MHHAIKPAWSFCNKIKWCHICGHGEKVIGGLTSAGLTMLTT